MRRRGAGQLFAILAGALAALTITTAAFAAEKDAAVAVDGVTGRVLYARNADAPRYPASLTKMMTLYLLFEALERGTMSMDTRITASRHAANQEPTKLGIDVGDTISVDTAIRAIVVRSANDVAVMVAEHLGGSESSFAVMMTRKAQAIGMYNTRFRNASGLPAAGQMTTARDLAMLGRRIAYDFPQYYNYFALSGFSYAGRYYATHDNLLGQFDGADGIKTGYTRISGFNLVTSVVRGGHHVVGVVMGGRTAHSRDQEMMWMLSNVFDQAADKRVQLASANVPWRAGAGSKTQPFDRTTPEPTAVAVAVVKPAAPPPAAAPAQPTPAPIVIAQRLPTAEDDRIAALIESIDDEDQAEQQSREPPRRAPVPVANPRQAIELSRVAHVTAAAAQSPTAPVPAVQPTPKPDREVRTASIGATRASRRGPIIEEGDIGDGPPPRVTPKPAAVVAARTPAPTPVTKPTTRAAVPAANAPRTWAVQIGAFGNAGEAKTQLAVYAERSMDVLGQARRIVTPFSGADGQKLFRARFGNFAEGEAREVCRRMTQRGQTCFATAAQ